MVLILKNIFRSAKKKDSFTLSRDETNVTNDNVALETDEDRKTNLLLLSNDQLFIV